MEENIKRIKQMENRLNNGKKIIEQLEKDFRKLYDYLPEIEILEKYLSSKEYKQDLKLDEQDKLPSDLQRGVLSEDGIYNLLEDVDLYKEFLDQLTVFSD